MRTTVEAAETKRDGVARSTPEAAGDIGRSLAEMDLECPPMVSRALVEAVAAGKLGYLGDTERGELQEAVASWQKSAYGWNVARDSIRPVADLVAGFRAVLTHFLPEGQPIIVPTPGYMPFISMPPQIAHPVVEVPMLRTSTGWDYDFAALRRAFESGARLLVLCNPHNPIGKVATAAELAQIEHLVDEFDGLVFADEIHAPLILNGASHQVYAARSERAAAHTITATSASKAFNTPGTKCGQLIFSNPEHLALWRRIGHWYEHQSSVLGIAATRAAYASGRPWLAATIEYLQEAVGDAMEILQETAQRTGIRVLRPEATYLLWIDLTETGLLRDDESAAETLRRVAGLIVTDGSDCGVAGRGFVRFNAALDRSHVREAMRRLVSAAEHARGNQ